MKKISKLFFLVILSFLMQVTYANQLDFYGMLDHSWKIDKVKINQNLENFYKNTGLNTDVIIIGKNDSCYFKANFDSCIQKRENYSSDLLIVLSMKSDKKDRGDIRSLVKDEFKEILTPRELKNSQDDIIRFFKQGDYNMGIIKHLSKIQSGLGYKCYKVGLKNCNAVTLSKEYHNYISVKEKEKANAAKLKFFYYLSTILSIILSYMGFKKLGIKFVNNLYKDVVFSSNSINEEKNIFEKDKKIISIKFLELKNILKNKLGDLDKNVFHIFVFYFKQKRSYIKIKNKLKKSKLAFIEREETEKKIKKVKNINL